MTVLEACQGDADTATADVDAEDVHDCAGGADYKDKFIIERRMIMGKIRKGMLRSLRRSPQLLSLILPDPVPQFSSPSSSHLLTTDCRPFPHPCLTMTDPHFTT